MKTFTITKYDTDCPVYLRVTNYLEGNLAVMMITNEGGEPRLWGILTVNLHGIREKDCAFIDINNNGEEILKWIEEYDLAEPTGTTSQSGHCSYPEYRFHADTLQEIDPKGYAAYLEEQKQLKDGR